MKKHTVCDVHFDGDKLNLTIDGNQKEFLISKISKRIAQASGIERNNFEISPSGYGIHWPLIDEDISIDGLLGIVHHYKDKVKKQYSKS